MPRPPKSSYLPDTGVLPVQPDTGLHAVRHSGSDNLPRQDDSPRLTSYVPTEAPKA